MSGNELDTLPNAGRHIVTTAHGAYVFDMDARTVDMGHGLERSLRTVRAVKGAAMTITWFGGGRTQHITTTPVVSIRTAP